MARIVRGGLIQASVGEDASAPLDHLKKRLVDKHVALIEEAARRDVQVACLQELFYGPYFPAEQSIRWYAMVEHVPEGPTVSLMQSLARKHRMVMIVPVYGKSYFCDPRGKIVTQASRDRDEVVVADLDLDQILEARNVWQFYRDRRPETYGPLMAL